MKKTSNETTKANVSTNDIASAQREAESVTLRDLAPEELYAHDLLQSSAIFLGEFTTKFNKVQLVAELESRPNLTPGDYQFKKKNTQTTHVVIDFMSKIRQWQ